MTGKLRPKKPGFIAQEVTLLRKLTKKKIKSTLPAPALLGERMWSAEKSSKAYPKRDDFVRACASWPRGKLPDDFYTPVKSDVPALILSGGPGVFNPALPAATGAPAKTS